VLLNCPVVISVPVEIEVHKKELSGIRGRCCNPSYWEDRIRGLHEVGSPPKEVAHSLWYMH
jgi:hypothetical protein